MPILHNEDFLRKVAETLPGVNPFSGDDKLENYAYFVRYMMKNSMLGIANDLVNLYPPKTVFCPLMMDLLPGFGGNVVKTFRQQMDEMKTIRDNAPDKFLPFVAIDPNNPDAGQIFEDAFSDNYNFFGIKIYPALGYMPSHPILMDIYNVCVRKGIPVVAHCGGDTVHVNKYKLTVEYMTHENDYSKPVVKEDSFFVTSQ